LIVCEGSNTEPDYIEHFTQFFRVGVLEMVIIGGAGETIRVVERAKKENEKGGFDQVWVVFDKDDFPTHHFDNAIQMAQAAGFGVAYSNQAFEYWLLLHFEDHQGGGMHRNDYDDKLNAYLTPLKANFDGKGSKSISSAFFQILMGKDPKTNENRLDLAIRRAERICEFHADKSSPALSESSTTVFRLVQELLKFAN
jgi:RloB-like protein